jgi:hypothetical protein
MPIGLGHFGNWTLAVFVASNPTDVHASFCRCTCQLCGVRMPVGLGYFASGIEGSRSARTQCEPGSYCDGSGIARPCPAGRYGNISGLTNDSCSGGCADGELCLQQTSSAGGQSCPTGSYCLAGMALPCPSGTYNAVSGATNASWCLPCPAGTFNVQTGSSSEAECMACPDHEGSDRGATACWPGILGTLQPSRREGTQACVRNLSR